MLQRGLRHQPHRYDQGCGAQVGEAFDRFGGFAVGLQGQRRDVDLVAEADLTHVKVSIWSCV